MMFVSKLRASQLFDEAFPIMSYVFAVRCCSKLGSNWTHITPACTVRLLPVISSAQAWLIMNKPII